MFWTDRTVDVSSVFPYPNEPTKRRLRFWLLFRCVVYTCRRNLLPRTWHARLPVPVVLRMYRARHALRDRSSYALHGRSSVVLRRHCSSSTVSLPVGHWHLSRKHRSLRLLLLRIILLISRMRCRGKDQVLTSRIRKVGVEVSGCLT